MTNTRNEKDGLFLRFNVARIVLAEEEEEEEEEARIVVSLLDVTERKRMEEALQRSEKKYRDLVESAVVGVYMTNLKGDILYVNATATRMFGFDTTEELISMGAVVRYKNPKDRDILIEILKKQGNITNFEFEAVTKTGETRVILLSSALTGDILTGMISDITERKRAEEQLLKLNKAVNTSGEVIFMTDREGIITFVNPEFTRLYGYTAVEVVGKSTPRILKSGVMKPENYVSFWQTLLNKQVVKGELINKTKDGRLLTIEGSVNPILDEQGEIVGFLAIQRDITARKQAEEALRESRARLARLSRRLVEAQEQERRRIARELHDEVGQSLTALTISLEGVSRLALDGVIRGKIAEIQELTKHLIAEVSALSVELRPRVLDDLGLIPGLLSLFSRFSTQTGVEIYFKHTGIERKRLAPEIEISAYRIIQEALTNVVRHAGVKMASVRLQRKDDILWIQVQDEGKGFDLQKAMNAEDSMGLLSMIERAEQVGGHLAVEAAPGEGTIITCRLPLDGNHVERMEYERDENHPGR